MARPSEGTYTKQNRDEADRDKRRVLMKRQRKIQKA
jgi:hypothetical protein